MHQDDEDDEDDDDDVLARQWSARQSFWSARHRSSATVHSFSLSPSALSFLLCFLSVSFFNFGAGSIILLVRNFAKMRIF